MVPDRLTVATYNIAHGEAWAEASEVLQTLEPLRGADIVLLQEMEETGVDQMASLLGYNYVYYPATRSPDGRNFGNAILARWPLTDWRKVILPGRHPVTGQQRIAVRASARIGNDDVIVYSTHTETPTTPASYRAVQIQAIVDDIGPGTSPVVVGGDFNTATGRGIERMEDQFATIGLTRATNDVGPTYTRFGFQPAPLDHIFVRGLAPIAAGRVEAEASDHFPVWVQLAKGGQ
jgi:endonuclease/exonuclease/phosphatase family metal-dependent hydrolase